jgi:chorismate mutase / prephenate dehydratase
MSDVVEELRAQLDAIDREIFAAVNRRIDVVARLKRHKEEHGIGFVDPDRERQMFDARAAENDGPLSDEGLRAFYTELLALCKREV